MAKYIDADLLRKEIERRRLSNRYIDTDGYEEELLEIIDSLQQEQPVEPDKSLEEAAEDFVWEVMEEDYDGPSELSKKLRPTSKISDFYNALAEFFKAGAKWGAKHAKNEEEL